MSDTPRTDGIVKLKWDGNEYVSIKFAHKLERESDQLVKQCVRNVEEIGELRAALVISEKKELATRAVIESWKEDEGADAARLDWLDNHVGLYDVAEYFGRDLLTHDQMSNLRLREGIDKAMEADNND